MTPFSARQTAGDVWQGPVRMPRNSAQHQKGSIHDDATAQKLGFRGGTVAGSLHMEQFPPLLMHLFGAEWWQSGSLSLYFRYATTDLEPVQCFAVAPHRLQSPGTQRTEVWMESAQPGARGPERIAEGTASIGPADCVSALRQRLNAVPEPGDLRILAGLTPKSACDSIATRVPAAALTERLDVITEPLVEYTDVSRWGRGARPPRWGGGGMRVVEPVLLARRGPVVGLFGAIEVQHFAGPLFVETDYEARGRIIAVSDTPKTEYFWYETVLTDPTEGKPVASMLMMLRFMKASSPLWQ